MKKFLVVLMLMLAVNVSAEKIPCVKPCTIDGRTAGVLPTGNLTLGQSADNVTPTFSIIGDADSDPGANTADTLSIVLTPTASPTASIWDIDSTQAQGIRFLKRVDILTTTADNKSAFNINQTSSAGSAIGIYINADYQAGPQGNGGDLLIHSTGSTAVSDDLKGWKVTTKYGRDASYTGNRMVDGIFGQALWNVNSTSARTGAYLTGNHINVGIGESAGDTTNPDTVTNATGLLVEKANFTTDGATALPYLTWTNFRGIWIKNKAVEVWSGDNDALAITNAYGLHLEDQTIATNNYGIVIDDGAECIWMDGITGTATCSETITISNSQLKNMASTPVALVATRGADYVIEFVSALLVFKYVDGTALVEPSAPDDMRIEYSGGTDITNDIDATNFLTPLVSRARLVLPDTTILTPTTNMTNMENQGLQIINTGENYTGNDTNNSTMDVKITYRVHKLGL